MQFFRARIEGAFDLIYEAATSRGGRDGKPAPPSMFLLGDHTRWAMLMLHHLLHAIHLLHGMLDAAYHASCAMLRHTIHCSHLLILSSSVGIFLRTLLTEGLLSCCNRKLVVIDHVQLPKIHTYHEVDRSQRYLESKGNIQKMSSFTRDANDLIATSKVCVHICASVSARACRFWLM